MKASQLEKLQFIYDNSMKLQDDTLDHLEKKKSVCKYSLIIYFSIIVDIVHIRKFK